MDPKRFESGASGRLVRAGRGEGTYWAFIPAPLPPAITFDGELVRDLSIADRSLGELAGVGRTLPNPHLLVGPFLRREAVLSSRIEGTQSDIVDLYAYEAAQLSLPGLPPPASDAREVLNYVRALEYGLRRLETLPVCLRLIREVQERLMEGVRGGRAAPGTFRRSQNWIGRPGSTLADADFVPPPPGEMEAALDAFEKYLHEGNGNPPLVRLALIHYQFEAIHPFLDGNGRIGRLILSLLLVHWNLLPLPLLYPSAFFERHREAYYEGLRAVSERGAWREWILFFLRGMAEQSQDAVARVKRLQDLQARWRRTLEGARSSALPLRVADSLFEVPLLSIPQVQKRLGVTYHTARRCVERLVEAGILQQMGEWSYGKVFFAPDILGIVADDASAAAALELYFS